jgi:hypothetical protein
MPGAFLVGAARLGGQMPTLPTLCSQGRRRADGPFDFPQDREAVERAPERRARRQDFLAAPILNTIHIVNSQLMVKNILL